MKQGLSMRGDPVRLHGYTSLRLCEDERVRIAALSNTIQVLSQLRGELYGTILAQN